MLAALAAMIGSYDNMQRDSASCFSTIEQKGWSQVQIEIVLGHMSRPSSSYGQDRAIHFGELSLGYQ